MASLIYHKAKYSTSIIDRVCQNIVIRTVNYITLTMELYIQSIIESLVQANNYDDFDAFFPNSNTRVEEQTRNAVITKDPFKSQ